ncbi:hypothetical protein KPH14_001978 [Odynerus spinipes]|uniref:Uncharacterized protein n=1 Tax=Odynerus spinipes TaxID=1348599 RepID=A0AAD9VXU3_9HYME|nr:hypothetical protein KPH14_001978 [Odynerus spinipes]
MVARDRLNDRAVNWGKSQDWCKAFHGGGKNFSSDSLSSPAEPPRVMTSQRDQRISQDDSFTERRLLGWNPAGRCYRSGLKISGALHDGIQVETEEIEEEEKEEEDSRA